MAKAQEWLSSFQYVCTSGPTFFERVAGVTGELRDCKEGLTTPIIGSLINTISDMITSLALMGAEAAGMGRLLLFICALLQFTAGPLSLGFTGYYGLMSRVREDDKAEMNAFRESVETQTVLMDQQQKALENSKITVKQLVNFVGAESQEPMKPPTIIEMKSSGSKKSRGLSALKNARIEDISDPIPEGEEGALRKSHRKTRAKRSRASRTRAKRSRSPRRRIKRTRRPSRRRY